MSLPVHYPDDGEASDYLALRKKVHALKGEHRTAIQEQQTHRGVSCLCVAAGAARWFCCFPSSLSACMYCRLTYLPWQVAANKLRQLMRR